MYNAYDLEYPWVNSAQALFGIAAQRSDPFWHRRSALRPLLPFSAPANFDIDAQHLHQPSLFIFLEIDIENFVKSVKDQKNLKRIDAQRSDQFRCQRSAPNALRYDSGSPGVLRSLHLVEINFEKNGKTAKILALVVNISWNIVENQQNRDTNGI